MGITGLKPGFTIGCCLNTDREVKRAPVVAKTSTGASCLDCCSGCFTDVSRYSCSQIHYFKCVAQTAAGTEGLYVCVCVFFLLLCIEYETASTTAKLGQLFKVGPFAGSHKFKGLFEDFNMVARSRLEQGLRKMLEVSRRECIRYRQR